MKELSVPPGKRSPLTYVSALDALETLSKQDLSERIMNVEKAVARGEAQLDDYWSFVACRQELARRVRHSEDVRPSVDGACPNRRSESCV